MVLQVAAIKMAFNKEKSKPHSKVQVFIQKKLVNKNSALILAPNDVNIKKKLEVSKTKKPRLSKSMLVSKPELDQDNTTHGELPY